MKGESGFTLVELLAALVAGGLLLALLSAVAGTFGQELHRSMQRDRFGEIATAGALLDHLLSGAEAGPGVSEPVEADAGHLTTFIDPPLARRGSGPMRLDLRVDRHSDGVALDLELTPARGGAPEHRTLVHGMQAIEIAMESKTASGRLPRLLTVAFTAADRNEWQLAVEPRLNGVGGCRFDPISLTCRP